MTTSPAAAQRCVGVASGDHDGARAGARAARSAGGERDESLPEGGGVPFARAVAAVTSSIAPLPAPPAPERSEILPPSPAPWGPSRR